MSFYIYENWGARTKNKPFTKIHKGSCFACNYGKGQRSDKIEGKNGRWHGAYSSFEDAHKIAKSFGYKFNYLCKLCMGEYE